MIHFILALLLMLAFTPSNDSIYDFTLTDIDGNEVALESYRGKTILIVNVASNCGYTPQYEGLQELYNQYKDEGLVILGFPANNFAGQEPGTEEDIKQFCTLNYGVEFPMFSKVSVKGDDQHEFFKYLTDQENQDFKGDIKWNFEKFLVDGNGNLIRRFRSNTKPLSEELTGSIESSLKR
ncbi:MAG: glutathione peroxidase [Bacteroidota bacterium]